MGILDKIKGGGATPVIEETDYLEVEDEELGKKGRLMIKIETLTDFGDTTRIQQHVRDGDIVWVKIQPLKEKDMTELRRAVDRLRKTCIAVNGDIAGIDEDFIVLTPPGVHVHRK